MSEAKEPVIHISGTVTEKDYTTAVRANGIRYCLKFTIVYILLMFFISLGINFYYRYPELKDGYIPFGEWLNEALKGFFRLSLSTYIIIGLLVFYAIYYIVVRPILAKKRLHELHPDGFPVTYDFYDDMLVIISSTQSSDETVRLKYADVQRKIKERKYIIVLSTVKRNRLGLYKAVMTSEDLERVRRHLNERCPQRKTRA